MKLVIGGVAQGKLDYVLENMIEESEKYDVYDCVFLKIMPAMIRHQTWNGHGILPSMMRVYS